MNKNCLIVGSNGQDAYFLTELLLKKNKKIHLIGKKSKFQKNKNIKIYDINTADYKSVFHFLSKFKNLIIFFLASTNIPSSTKEKSQLHFKNLSTNVNSLANFLEYIAMHNKKIKLFYACSSQIFNDTKTKLQNESTNPHYNTNYALSKYLGKTICDFYRRKKVFCSTGIMYSHVSKLSKKNFLIKKILAQIKHKNKYIKVYDSSAKVDLTSPLDVVGAMYKIMNLKKPDNFIISSNKLVTVKEIIRNLEKILKLKPRKIISLKKKSNEKKTILRGDNSKIYQKCKWRPLNNLDSILKSFI